MTAERSLISVPDPGAMTATLTGPESQTFGSRDRASGPLPRNVS